jgi:hypothetical protein
MAGEEIEREFQKVQPKRLRAHRLGWKSFARKGRYHKAVAAPESQLKRRRRITYLAVGERRVMSTVMERPRNDQLLRRNEMCHVA